MAAQEPNEEKSKDAKKKLNDDVITFVKKRSEHDAPQYTAKLKTYVQIQGKRSRANDARRHAQQRAAAAADPAARERRERHERDAAARDRNENSRGRPSSPQGGDKALEPPPPSDHAGSVDGRVRRRHEGSVRERSMSGSVSEPSDRCGRRRRRKRKKRCGRRRRRRRRRRSCGRRRRRRRRSRRRRRRKRSCSCKRRKRRRSCKRRRRRRRRRRC